MPLRSLLSRAFDVLRPAHVTPAENPSVAPAPREKCFGDLLTEHWRNHWSLTKTARQVDTVLRLYLRPAFDELPLSHITRERVQAWHLEHRAKSRMANRALKYGRQCWNALEPDRVNPFQRVKPFQERSRNRRFTDDERARWLTALSEMRREGGITEVVADALFVLRNTAARKTEILALRRTQIDLRSQIAVLEDHKTDDHENCRTIHLGAVMDIISRRVAAAERDGSLFVFPGTGKSGHIVNVGAAWKAVCQRAGIVHTRDLVPHMLRGDFATKALDENVDLRVIQAILGHSDPSTTARYARASQDTARRATTRVGHTLGVQPW